MAPQPGERPENLAAARLEKLLPTTLDCKLDFQKELLAALRPILGREAL